MDNFTFADLFAGIGGLRLGFEAAGGRCVFSSEIDAAACDTYEKNFGERPDITKIDAADIPNFDILLAGFPCQAFSIIGKRESFENETCGTLFFEIERMLKAKKPAAFLLENVKNLKSHDKGKTWKVITDSLNVLDYEIFSAVLDGKFFVPQHRERTFIVGFDNKRYQQSVDFNFNFETPKKISALKDILENDVAEKYTLSDKLWHYLQVYAEKHRAKGNGFGFGLPDLNGISRTLSARYYKDGSEILIRQENKNPRKLTPRECARLQGFPENFKIANSDTRAYKQFGNSVVVPLVGAIAKNIVSALKNLEEN